MNKRIPLAVLFAVLAGPGCSTSTPIGIVDNGGSSGSVAGATTTGGSSGAAGQAAQGPYVPSGAQVLNDQPFTNPTGVSDDWVGYLENYSLYFLGSDAVRLHFGVDAQGNNVLTVVRGMGVPPAPPTDPFQAWPVPIVNDTGGPGPGEVYPDAPIAGFAYTAHEVTWQGSRLKFSLLNAEPWTTWCGLQTSYRLPDNDPEDFTCNAGNTPMYSNSSPKTCTFPNGLCTLNHLAMCILTSGFCACNATGCGASTSHQTAYDVTFFGDHAVGSMEMYNLILTPATP
jgi:hypothetical protein